MHTRGTPEWDDGQYDAAMEQMEQAAEERAMTIQQMIAHLEELYARRDLAQADYTERYNAILTPEQRAAIAQLDSEHAETMEEISEAVKAAEEQVKAQVAACGETIKGQRWQAVYSKPRVSWDTRRLEQYAKANDMGIFEFRKEGTPSVSIRAIKAE
jgi:multidrug resistance efflux pump